MSPRTSDEYLVEHDARQRWAWNVVFRGKTIARCDSRQEADQVKAALVAAKELQRHRDTLAKALTEYHQNHDPEGDWSSHWSVAGRELVKHD